MSQDPIKELPTVTTLRQPPAATRQGVRPRVVGRTGLYAVLLANAVVVAVFFVQAGFASNTLIVLGG